MDLLKPWTWRPAGWPLERAPDRPWRPASPECSRPATSAFGTRSRAWPPAVGEGGDVASAPIEAYLAVARERRSPPKAPRPVPARGPHRGEQVGGSPRRRQTELIDVHRRNEPEAAAAEPVGTLAYRAFCARAISTWSPRSPARAGRRRSLSEQGAPVFGELAAAWDEQAPRHGNRARRSSGQPGAEVSYVSASPSRRRPRRWPPAAALHIIEMGSSTRLATDRGSGSRQRRCPGSHWAALGCRPCPRAEQPGRRIGTGGRRAREEANQGVGSALRALALVGVSAGAVQRP